MISRIKMTKVNLCTCRLQSAGNDLLVETQCAELLQLVHIFNCIVAALTFRKPSTATE
uniref:Uncharacterized protein n=1 Tax=Parascaris univalens TaxID=6257 RepID=A0A915BQH0_PARUN